MLLLLLLLLLLGACRQNSTADSPSTLFREVAAETSGIAFRNELRPTEELNIVTYLYYYNGGGVAVGDVNGDRLPDLFFTANQGDNQLYVNEGGLRFREVTAEAGIRPTGNWSSGASFADVDGDGDLDLYVCEVSGVAGLTGRNRLYVNDGSGHFEERAEEFGLGFAGLSTQAAFFDADRDGDLDLYLLNHSVHSTERQGDTTARRSMSELSGDRFFLQQESGEFVDATSGSGLYSSRLGYGLGLAVADFDDDGFVDVYVGNDFSESDYFYRNLGGGRFREIAWLTHGSQFSMGNVAADLNADGRLDLLTLDMRPPSDSVRKSSANSEDVSLAQTRIRQGFGYQLSRNTLQLNLPSGFVDVAPQWGVHSTDWSWAPAALDADLDGYTDLAIGNGIVARPNDLDYIKFSSGDLIQRRASNLEIAALMTAGYMPNAAFRGTPDSGFVETAAAWGLASQGSTTALIAVDLDLDGDEDIVTNNVNDVARIYENTRLGPDSTGADARSVTIQLLTAAGAPAVGTTVMVSQREWKRSFALQPVSGFQSSVLAPQVIGLHRSAEPFELLIRWPRGQVQRLTQLTGDQILREPSTDAELALQLAPDRSSIPEFRHPWTPEVLAAFDANPLLPVVPDDWGSCVVGDPRGVQSGVQRPALGAVLLPTGQRLWSRGCPEEVATWELRFGESSTDAASHRLLRRGGESGGTGLIDRFLVTPLTDIVGGGWLVLGFSQHSAQGLSKPATSLAWRLMPNRELFDLVLPQGDGLGCVTDAVSVGDSAILISALWEPVRELRWRPTTQAESGISLELTPLTPNGLWTKILRVERGGDQQSAYLFANIGLNTLLIDEPGSSIELNVADFDRNGEADPILTRISAEGVRRTYFGLDVMARQMPGIRKFFVRYLPFSASQYDDMFPAIERVGGRKYTATEFRSMVYQPSEGRMKALPFHLQVGTPTAVETDSTSVGIRYATPLSRPEIGASFFGELVIPMDSIIAGAGAATRR